LLFDVFSVFPERLKKKLEKLPQDILHDVEEVRIRMRRPIEISYRNHWGFLTENGKITKLANLASPIDDETFEKTLNLISNYSIYTLEEELKRGYITIKGGHRVGLAGKVIMENSQVKMIKAITGMNIRIAKEKRGAADPLLPYLIEPGGRICNTLIISPPQCGKTTLLRDLARQFGNGNRFVSGKKVGIVDERSEIAGCVDGIAQKDVGIRTDVLDACPKAEGMMMLIRSMSPEVIVVDEIGRKEDAEAILEAINAGISLIASAHGARVEEITRRPILSLLLSQQIFDRYVILSRRHGAGTIEAILDRQFVKINEKKEEKTACSNF
jgi:stage III sporulation protein AA